MSRDRNASKTSKPAVATGLRADAQRNRERILASARKLFERLGPTVEMDDVARGAGVGVGTIYRHFETKEALIEGVLSAHLRHLVEAAASLSSAEDPGGAFFAFLELLAREFLARGRLHHAVAMAGHSPPATSPDREALRTGLRKLLTRAQAARAVRGEVGVEEVILLLRGALLPPEGDAIPESARRRMFAIVCRGLRPE